MIFAYYDENGILKETITKPVRVGDDGYDKVYLFFAGKDYSPSINAYPANVAEGSAITSTFRNSGDGIESVEAFSDTEIRDIPFDPERDLKFFRYYTNYQFYVAEVPTSVLATAGSVSCTPRQIYGDSDARAYGTLIFPIEGGVVIADHAISSSEYNYLLNHISVGAVFYPNVSAEGIISWTNEMGLPNPPSRDIAGPGIESIEKISGTGAPGTADTYRISYAGGRTADFSVYNGKDGKGFKAQEITDSSAFASFVEAHYDEIVACFITEAGTQHLDVTHFCQIVKDEYADDPDYGTRTQYRIVYTDYDAASHTETTSLNALPTGATLMVFYGQESVDDSLKMFTSGESNPSYERRHVERGTAKATIETTSSEGGSLIVTDSAGTSTTAYKKGAIRNGLYNLTLPEKNGTLATLDDVISSDYAFTSGNSQTSGGNVSSRYLYNPANDTRATLVASQSGGGMLIVTKGGDSSYQTSYEHGKIVTGGSYGAIPSYTLTLPNKTGTLATLSDIPASVRYCNPIPSGMYKDDYFFLPNEWETWLTASFPTMTWDEFLAALGITTDKTRIYVRVAYGSPFGGSLYSTRGYMVYKTGGMYSERAAGELYDNFLLYFDSEGTYQWSVYGTMSGTSIYARGSSPFVKIAEMNDASKQFNMGSDTPAMYRELRYNPSSAGSPRIRLQAEAHSASLSIYDDSGKYTAYGKSGISVQDADSTFYRLTLPKKNGTLATTDDITSSVYAFTSGTDGANEKQRSVTASSSSASKASIIAYADNSKSGLLKVEGGQVYVSEDIPDATTYENGRIGLKFGSTERSLVFQDKDGIIATVDDIGHFDSLLTFSWGQGIANQQGEKYRVLSYSGTYDNGAAVIVNVGQLGGYVKVQASSSTQSSYLYCDQLKYKRGTSTYSLAFPQKSGTLATIDDVPGRLSISGSSLANALDQLYAYIAAGTPMIEAVLSYSQIEGGVEVTKRIKVFSWDWEAGVPSESLPGYYLGWTIESGEAVQVAITYTKSTQALTIKYLRYSI